MSLLPHVNHAAYNTHPTASKIDRQQGNSTYSQHHTLLLSTPSYLCLAIYSRPCRRAHLRSLPGHCRCHPDTACITLHDATSTSTYNAHAQRPRATQPARVYKAAAGAGKSRARCPPCTWRINKTKSRGQISTDKSVQINTRQLYEDKSTQDNCTRQSIRTIDNKYTKRNWYKQV